MASVNRIELEREWHSATMQADHWVDVIQDLERQIQQAGTLQSRLENAKSEFSKANQIVRELSNKLAQL